MSKGALYIEALLVLMGMRTYTQACGTLFIAGTGYIVLHGAPDNMETFFIPAVENATIFITLIGYVAGLIIAIGINSMRKKDSKGSGEPWKAKYIGTTLLVAVGATTLSWLLVGMFVQTFFADITLELYIICIVLATIPFTKWGFTLANDGPEAMVAEIVGNIGTAKGAADQIKRKMNE